MDVSLLRSDRSANRFTLTNGFVFGATVTVVSGVVLGSWAAAQEPDGLGYVILWMLLAALLCAVPAILTTITLWRFARPVLECGSVALVPATSLAGALTVTVFGLLTQGLQASAIPDGAVFGAAAGLAGALAVRVRNACSVRAHRP